jgi:hypothetical protein
VAFLGVSIVVYLDRIRRHMRPSVHTGHLNWNHSGISRLKFFNLVEYRSPKLNAVWRSHLVILPDIPRR